DGQIRNKPTDGVHEAVIAVEGDQSRDPQEGGGTHVVTGDREPVLPAADLAAGRVELDGRSGLQGRPDRDSERNGDADGRDPQGGGHDPNPMRAARRRTAAASGSKTRLARLI